jgi:putative colanic acid biosynthesis acetyltransferase WcaF
MGPVGYMGEPAGLDIAANRARRKYRRGENARRVAWWVGEMFFRFSPRPLFAWRRFVLRVFGARIGHHVHVYPTTWIEMPWNVEIGDWSAVGERAVLYSLGRISIGVQVTISQHAHICAGTHDFRKADMALLRPPIRIEDRVWICADAFVGPDVVVGEGAVVGARAVVVRAVAPWTIVAGNPARPIGTRILEK